MQLLFPQNETIRNAELAIPHLTCKVCVSERKYRLDVTSVQSLRTFFQLPSGNTCEAVLRQYGRGTKHGKDEGNTTTNWFFTIKYRPFANKELLMQYVIFVISISKIEKNISQFSTCCNFLEFDIFASFVHVPIWNERLKNICWCNKILAQL